MPWSPTRGDYVGAESHSAQYQRVNTTPGGGGGFGGIRKYRLPRKLSLILLRPFRSHIFCLSGDFPEVEVWAWPILTTSQTSLVVVGCSSFLHIVPLRTRPLSTEQEALGR